MPIKSKSKMGMPIKTINPHSWLLLEAVDELPNLTLHK